METPFSSGAYTQEVMVRQSRVTTGLTVRETLLADKVSVQQGWGRRDRPFEYSTSGERTLSLSLAAHGVAWYGHRRFGIHDRMALFANKDDQRRLSKPAAEEAAYVLVSFGDRPVQCSQRVFAAHEEPYRLMADLATATDPLEIEEKVVQPETAVRAADGQGPETVCDGREMSYVRDLLHGSVGQQLTIAELSEAVFLSRSQLVRSFRASFGTPIYSYLKSLRLEGARYWLRSSELPVATVAHRHGFTSESSFSREFRKRYGRTPGSERKTSRSEQS